MKIGEKKVILGLVGSPRRLGNCEVMVKEIGRWAAQTHNLQLIRMPSLHIEPCRACYACVTGKSCPHGDDMDFLLDRIAEADGIIMATPVYFLGAHSIFKRVLDRGFLFYRVLEKTFGKPCILLNLYGMEDRLGASPHTLRSFAAFLGLAVKADMNLQAALPGEISLEETSGPLAEKLAGDLFSEMKPAAPAGGCPFCGCTIVRMDKARFLCTICHGSFFIDGSGAVSPLKEGSLFGSPAHMLLHQEWLRSMKEQFLERRKEILRNTLQYKNMGEWVYPEGAGSDGEIP
ncbi:MAG TPA: flavodoxin family protein [Syntrophorhabdaceae bacterium]|jgi:multimeric flavodoxin WrbA